MFEQAPSISKESLVTEGAWFVILSSSLLIQEIIRPTTTNRSS